MCLRSRNLGGKEDCGNGERGCEERQRVERNEKQGQGPNPRLLQRLPQHEYGKSPTKRSQFVLCTCCVACHAPPPFSPRLPSRLDGGTVSLSSLSLGSPIDPHSIISGTTPQLGGLDTRREKTDKGPPLSYWYRCGQWLNGRWKLAGNSPRLRNSSRWDGSPRTSTCLSVVGKGRGNTPAYIMATPTGPIKNQRTNYVLC